MLYASGTLRKVTPDSRVKDGIMAIVWSGIKDAKGFSSCCCVLSWTYSVAILRRGGVKWEGGMREGGVLTTDRKVRYKRHWPLVFWPS